MAIWKDPAPAAKTPEPARFDPPPSPLPSPLPEPAAPVRAVEPPARESVIAADLQIEGKIEGSGHVRIAGRFKGDVKVQGNLGIEPGACVHGGIHAQKVVVAGELEGNILGAQQVELQQTGVINGDVKAGSLTVAAGSRIRGHVECGWDARDGKDSKPGKPEASAAA